MGKNVAVFVDVANIFYAAKAAGVDIDYVTLLKSATAGRDFVRAYAYTGLDPENENQRNFHSFLARHGYKVVSKDIRKYGDGKVKANLDIELVVDMMKTARNLDVAVVISGDGDFAPAIRAVQEMGVRVEVISFRGNTSSDLMDVADQFTDIIQIAKVEKGSSRSGRRVAGDDEDLSMTEVPDKQTEGTGRGRGRGRVRTGTAEPVAAGTSSGRGRGRSAATQAPAAAAPAAGGLVALPGEKLSKAAEARIAAAGVETPAAAVTEGPPDAEVLDADGGDGEHHRRRRRRGGRGRGRGRAPEASTLEAALETGAIETLYVEELDDLEEADELETVEDAEPITEAPPRRAPRPAAFGSVWDTQIGMPSGPSADLGVAGEDEEFDEPEIPEYLIAEQRRGAAGSRTGGRQGDRGGRGGRGGRSAYVAAMDRERFGGRGGGGLNRYPDVSGRTQQRSEPTRRPDRTPGRPAPAERPAGGGRSSGGDPWSEVPPEVDQMLRAQMASRTGGSTGPAHEPAATQGRATAEATAEPTAEAEKPKRRTTRKPAATTVTAEATAEPTAEAEKPKRRTTRKPAATTVTAEATVEPTAEADKPKRRTTRKPAAPAG